MSQASPAIPQKLFFKIGEVCELAGVQAHVLRYWETEFPTLAPQKNRAGQRTYRRKDVEMALRIRELLDGEAFIIKQFPDPQRHLNILAPVGALSGPVLLRLEHGELRLPVAQHMRLDFD